MAIDLLGYVQNKEGFRENAYDDGTGVWTVGFGQTYINGRPVKPGDSITKAEATKYTKGHLGADRDYVKEYSKKYGYGWNDSQVDAMTSFVYNGGRGWLDQVTAGGTRDNETIGNKMRLYNKAGGVELPGLVTRRNEEADVFMGKSSRASGPESKTTPLRAPLSSLKEDRTFSEAFAEARKAHGPGHAFIWKGKNYSTDYKEETPVKKYFNGTGFVPGTQVSLSAPQGGGIQAPGGGISSTGGGWLSKLSEIATEKLSNKATDAAIGAAEGLVKTDEEIIEGAVEDIAESTAAPVAPTTEEAKPINLNSLDIGSEQGNEVAQNQVQAPSGDIKSLGGSGWTKLAGAALGGFNDGAPLVSKPVDEVDRNIVAGLIDPSRLSSTLVNGMHTLETIMPFIGPLLSNDGINSVPAVQRPQLDTVPAMLTEGEAIIPMPAAQNPANKPLINDMIEEGRIKNRMMYGPLVRRR